MFKSRPDPAGAAYLITYITRLTHYPPALDMAFDVYDHLVKHTSPNVYVFQALVGACRKQGKLPKILPLWSEFEKYGIIPNKV